ncbi:SMP-30/gluconolactonase/LRE family protein [Hymenobacter sp. 5317J-9]|uniref:SMP-30/gluconolactonase/LRE family protein n=1 Tax=Hymenobacter sp. 5317J-9 TaxID=2932250 RepID=UPI001FD6F7FA|nr:SMP-30/gluconolactonase/LRE family protein [Hymenobacter sp. 5317J-9]UOQ99170.1 SMP-30/gluconolactonase/LRE family protein [Hymenobacter sp. 5317J-9]
MVNRFFPAAAGFAPLPHLARLTAAALGFLALLPGCSKDDEPTTPAVTNPARISVPQAGVYPEGIQWDEASKRFYVSSRAKGTVGTVRDDSTYTEFGKDSRLISTIGLNLDASRSRLLAAVSDNNFNPSVQNQPTLRKLAALAIFNSSTGALTSYVDLGGLRPAGMHFANDIAVDKDGNAYITDSMSPIIYKVDLQGNATVFLENSQLSGGTGFGLNGIVYHPDGYLLTAKTSDGTLYKVPISNPAGFTTVTKTQSLVGADGLLLFDNNTLLVVAGSQGTVFRMASTDAWVSTTATGSFATGAVSATTITKRGSDAYVLYPYSATAPRFRIVKVNF